MEDYTQDDCIRDTKEHINQVREYMMIFAEQLLERARVHDQSKLESPELEVFTEYTPKLKQSTYGSEEYFENLKGMKKALDHHYANNSHHPEHRNKYVCNGCFKEIKHEPEGRCDICGYSQYQIEADVSQMDLLDIVEMLCDWKAATQRHADGNIYHSVEANQKRFNYTDETKQILLNTLERVVK